MQDRFLYRWRLIFQDLLNPQDCPTILTPTGLKGELSKTPCRVYLSISHSLLTFYPIRVPQTLSDTEKIKAAKLEARRLFNLFKPEVTDLSLACWEGREDLLWVAAIPLAELNLMLEKLPSNVILSGIFPAWVALWAYFNCSQKDGLYFIRTSWGYEGFVLEEGKFKELLPTSQDLARAYIDSYKGQIFEATTSPDPETALLSGTLKVPELFPEAPTLEVAPLKLRPKFSKRHFVLWGIPLLIFLLGQGLNFQKIQMQNKLNIIEQRLNKVEITYKKIQQQRRIYNKSLLIKQKTSIYLKENRPSLLRALEILSIKMPATTWVKRMEFKFPDEIRIWAEGEDALKTLNSLSQTSYFKEVKLGSSVTKNPRTGKETFYLLIKLRKPPL